jgi:ribosome biogenesis GTPase A
MNKAIKMMDFEVKNVDLILYCLDSRAPFSCLNPNFESILSRKPVIFVLNKQDLADEKETKKWLAHLDAKSGAFALDSTISGAGYQLKNKIKNILQHKVDRNLRKGINIPLRAMVIGVPNTGKSTLINNLCGVARAITGDRPGVTKGKQWIKIDSDLELMDTPGTLAPDFESEIVGLHLAYVGSIREEVLDLPSLCLEFLKEFKTKYAENLVERYGVLIGEREPIEIFDEICLKRGWILKKNEPDYQRGAKAILDDFKKGRLGRVTLDEFKD